MRLRRFTGNFCRHFHVQWPTPTVNTGHEHKTYSRGDCILQHVKSRWSGDTRKLVAILEKEVTFVAPKSRTQPLFPLKIGTQRLNAHVLVGTIFHARVPQKATRQQILPRSLLILSQRAIFFCTKLSFISMKSVLRPCKLYHSSQWKFFELRSDTMEINVSYSPNITP